MSSSRRQFLGSVAAAGPAVGLSQLGRTALADTGVRPNIVLLLTDQHSQRELGYLGSRNVETPFIDALAAEGTTFAESYCADPACCPSRASIFTGRASSEHGVMLNRLPLRSELPELGAWLRAHSDYQTAYMGKWHVPCRDVTEGYDVLASAGFAGERCDSLTARAFEGFLGNVSTERPFFAVVSLVNPHDICLWLGQNAIGLDFDRFGLTASDLPSLPPNFHAPHADGTLYRSQGSKRIRDSGSWDREKVAVYRWIYHRYIEMMDAVAGRVVDAVRNSPFSRDTVILFTSDHGEMQGEHGALQKSDLYDGATRVPTILSWPGEIPGGVIDSTNLVSGLDIFPTVCDLAGVAVPPGVRGGSLRKLADGSAESWRDVLQAQTVVEGRMIRTADYKYIRWRNEATELLFRAHGDPWELENLAGDSAFDGVLQEMRELEAAEEAQLDNTALAEAGYEAALAARTAACAV